MNKAKDRAHILEGLAIALLKINEIIETIKKSKDKDDAKVNLMKKFKLTEPQTVAILEMRLQQLANLERLKVEQEYEEKMKLIKELGIHPQVGQEDARFDQKGNVGRSRKVTATNAARP